MSTTQLLCKTGTWQSEPQRILVERTPVEEREKLPLNRIELESIKGNSWADLQGLSLGFEEEWF